MGGETNRGSSSPTAPSTRGSDGYAVTWRDVGRSQAANDIARNQPSREANRGNRDGRKKLVAYPGDVSAYEATDMRTAESVEELYVPAEAAGMLAVSATVEVPEATIEN